MIHTLHVLVYTETVFAIRVRLGLGSGVGLGLGLGLGFGLGLGLGPCSPRSEPIVDSSSDSLPVPH